MRKIVPIFIILTVFVLCASADAFARMVTARSVSSGTYEDGKFTPGSSGFKAEYIIDEDKETVSIAKVIENNREGRVEEDEPYEITNVVMSEGPSALLVSRNKKGQKIITAVRETGLGASETIILGDDFYEYCRGENGKFYLEYGEVTR